MFLWTVGNKDDPFRSSWCALSFVQQRCPDYLIAWCCVFFMVCTFLCTTALSWLLDCLMFCVLHGVHFPLYNSAVDYLIAWCCVFFMVCTFLCTTALSWLLDCLMFCVVLSNFIRLSLRLEATIVLSVKEHDIFTFMCKRFQLSSIAFPMFGSWLWYLANNTMLLFISFVLYFNRVFRVVWPYLVGRSFRPFFIFSVWFCLWVLRVVYLYLYRLNKSLIFVMPGFMESFS